LKVSAKIGTLVVSALVLAGISCLLMVRRAPLFYSCRVFYRIHNVVADSFRCRVFSTLNVAMIVLFIVAAICALTWSFLLLHRCRNGMARN